MHTRKWLSAVLFASVLFLSSCSDDSNVVSFADFSTFRFEQLPALGFCPHEPWPVKLEITRALDGTGVAGVYELEMRGTSDSCFYPVSNDSCWVLSLSQERALSLEEMKDIEALFSAVRIYNGPECNAIYDPCAIWRLSWDDFGAPVFDCTSRWRIDWDDAQPLLLGLFDIIGIPVERSTLPE